MRIHRVTTEQILYMLAFLLALGLRLVRLGAAPLSDFEAGWALQALAVSGGSTPAPFGAQPGYVLLTGLLFWLFGSSGYTARLLPALAGAALVWLPYLFQRRLALGMVGRLAGLICAFGLALDPGLAALSRLAGGPVMAASFAYLALALNRRPVAAGIFAGSALLMGPAALHGLLALGLAWAAIRLLERSGRLAPMEFGQPVEPPVKIYPLLISAGLTVLIVGTLLLRYPAGLSAWMSSVPVYLSGWVNAGESFPPGVPALRLPAALPFYTPLALLFGLAGCVWAFLQWMSGGQGYRMPAGGEGAQSELSQEERSQVGYLPAARPPEVGLALRAGIWLLAALLLALVYPSRQVGDLVWALVPLWMLAALQLARLLVPAGEIAGHLKVTTAAQAALLFVLFALFWLNLAGLTQTPFGTQAFALRLGVMFGVVALAALTTVLVGLGWSWQAAGRGLVWGLCLTLGAATLSASLGATQQRGQSAAYTGASVRQELWLPGDEIVQAGLLVQTLRDLASWKTGWPADLDIAVAVDSPALRWALRDFPKARFTGEVSSPQARLLAPGQAPAVVITRQAVQEPGLSAAYRGQDFTWGVSPAWQGVLPPDFFRWWAFRLAPAETDQVILWARTDLFPGSAGQIDEPQTSPGEAVPGAEP